MLATETGLGTEGLTIVGGSALEIYTTGDYVSADVDLVAEDRGRVVHVLQLWGFASKGMYWISPDLDPSVQIVGKYDSGSRQLSQVVTTRYGRVRLAALEDIVVKRLIEARHWARPEALAEAMLAVSRSARDLDWEYLIQTASRDGVADLALDLRRRGAKALGRSGADPPIGQP
ncbi:MAG: hypothetical protein L3K23_03385 [Thermoplasmata archaeon]|nr:hypothetical protein [Thermoplasmata archaeon]